MMSINTQIEKFTKEKYWKYFKNLYMTYPVLDTKEQVDVIRKRIKSQFPYGLPPYMIDEEGLVKIIFL